MLQLDEPIDLVVGTGTSITVRDFLSHSFGSVGLDWNEFVKFDKNYLRPTEVDALQADPTLARRAINWSHSVSTEQLAQEMVKSDIENLDGGTRDRPIGDLWREETQ